MYKQNDLKEEKYFFFTSTSSYYNHKSATYLTIIENTFVISIFQQIEVPQDKVQIYIYIPILVSVAKLVIDIKIPSG